MKTPEDMSNGDVQMRVDTKFAELIKEIKKKRLEYDIDKIKSSDRFITSPIVKHKFSERIKEDCINYGGEDE